MKKFLSVVMLCVAVLVVSSNPSSADRISNVISKWEQVSISIGELGRKIVQNNKPAFEAKLSKSERMIEGWDSGIFYFRVWAKDMTLVVGNGNKKKQFYADHIQTRDPKMVFVGGIHVGASTSVLEKFFGYSLKQIEVELKTNEILYLPENDVDAAVRILHKDGIITEIEMYIPDMECPALTKKTVEFIKQKKAQMGLSEGWM